MPDIYLTTLARILAALLAGGLIGLERTYHGRPAGFRTHTLVCMASASLMLLAVFQVELLPGLPPELVRIDPTRMAQGIMTGIGFLGAGVIMKERLTIRGLTTAASVWITASIGILIGVGFYFAAAVTTLITFGALSVFRWIETTMPTQHYARLEVRTVAQRPLSLEQLQQLIEGHSCEFTNPGYELSERGKLLTYEVTVRTRERDNFRRLSDSLLKTDKVAEFKLHPSSD